MSSETDLPAETAAAENTSAEAPTAENPAADSADSLVGLINQLVEPLPPEPVAMVPQTAGWAVLAILLAVAAAALIVRAVRRHRANAYRREALAALDAAGNDAAAIAAILRRTALAAWPRSEVAQLSGGDWLAFLDETGGGGAFAAGGAGEALSRAPYQRGGGTAPDALIAAARRWLRRHKRPQAEVRP